MLTRVQKKYEYLLEVFKWVQDEMHEVQKQLEELRTPEEFADAAYAMREMEKLTDSMRKTFKKCRERQESLACLVAMSEDLTRETIQTPYVTARIESFLIPKLPGKVEGPDGEKTPTPELTMLRNWLGLGPELFSYAHDVVTIHWPGIQCLFGNRLENGLPLPPGCDHTEQFQRSGLRMRRKIAVNATPPQKDS